VTVAIGHRSIELSPVDIPIRLSMMNLRRSVARTRVQDLIERAGKAPEAIRREIVERWTLKIRATSSMVSSFSSVHIIPWLLGGRTAIHAVARSPAAGWRWFIIASDDPSKPSGCPSGQDLEGGIFKKTFFRPGQAWSPGRKKGGQGPQAPAGGVTGGAGPPRRPMAG